jgi:hypothetical protein
MAIHKSRRMRTRKNRSHKRGGSIFGWGDSQPAEPQGSLSKISQDVKEGWSSLGNSISNGWNQLSTTVSNAVSGKKPNTYQSSSMMGGRKRKGRKSRKTRKSSRRHK